MPTILTHPAVPLAVGVALGTRVVPSRLLLAGVALSILPDIDVLAFRYGIDYSHSLGHRGFSHSLLFALVSASVCAAAYRPMRSSFAIAFPFLFFAAVSHGVLDAFTNGGLGIAFLWPWSDARYFAPLQPIEVSPIGLMRFLSARGMTVVISELRWVWLPLVVFALGFAAMRCCIARFIERKGRPSGQAESAAGPP